MLPSNPFPVGHSAAAQSTRALHVGSELVRAGATYLLPSSIKDSVSLLTGFYLLMRIQCPCVWTRTQKLYIFHLHMAIQRGNQVMKPIGESVR